MYAACIQRAKEANKNIEAVILGCTEISELHDAYPITAGLPIIDPLVVLAKEVCQRAFAAV